MYLNSIINDDDGESPNKIQLQLHVARDAQSRVAGSSAATDIYASLRNISVLGIIYRILCSL